MKTLVLILILLIPLPMFGEEPKTPIDVEMLLSQTELNVLIRQYEKALTEYYDVKLQVQLLPIMAGATGAQKDEVARQTELMQARLNLLTEWRDEIRSRVQRLVDMQNQREKARLELERKKESRPASPSPSPSGNKSSSPSQRTAPPQF